MDDAVWEQIMATQAGTETPAVDEAATEAAAPEVESPPEGTPAPESVVAEPAPETPVAEEPVAEAAPVTEQTAPDPAAEPPDWRQHPEAREALAALEFKQQLAARAAEARRLQAQQQFQNRLNDLSDGDAERLQSLTGLVAEATTPLQQMAQMQHQRAETSEKSAAALFIAMESVLTDQQKQQILAEHATLMGVDGVEVMQQIAYGKRDFTQRLNQTVAAKDAEIAELKRQIAAQSSLAQRDATRADAVDGGGGASTPPDTRAQMQQASSFDDYWAAMMGRSAA